MIMKNLKKIAMVAMLGIMSFGVYSTYEYVVTTDAEHLMMENVEALTGPETGDDHRYPERSGNALFCTLYVYTKGSIVVKSEDVQTGLEASGEYTKTTVSGLKDRCPNRGNGCDPYSCQEVPY